MRKGKRPSDLSHGKSTSGSYALMKKKLHTYKEEFQTGKPTLLFENKDLVLPKNKKKSIIIQNGSVYKGTGSIRDDTMQLALFC